VLKTGKVLVELWRSFRVSSGARVMLASLVAMVSPAAFGSTLFLVVPNAQTSTPGNDFSGINGDAFHIQDVFGSNQFAGIPGDLLITQVAVRAAPGTGSVSMIFSAFDMYLSTTPFYPNSVDGPLLTDTYSTNTGPDNTLVYSGPLTLSSPGCTGPSACPFDMVVTLTTPFVYSPNRGNLLWDIQTTPFSGSGVLDAVSFAPPGGSAAFLIGRRGDTTGTVVPFAHVLQVGYTTVPEPGSCALMLIGATVFVVARRRRLG
jgi:hypothetical protein